VTWLRYFLPDEEKKDRRFERELARLSVTGVRAISGVCLGGATFWIVIAVFVFPEFVSSPGVAAMVSVFALGCIALGVSFWRPIRPWSRVLALALLAALVALDVMGSAEMPITEGELWAFFTASAILMMLIAIGALPVQPLQMAALGSAYLGMYLWLLVDAGAWKLDGGPATIGFMFLLMTVVTCTGLTAIVYHQRVVAFRSRRAAEQAFEELREAQVRVGVSENAASQSRFAAALSHDLNSPLGALTSAFDTMLHAHERETTHPALRSELEEIWADAARAGRESSTRLHEMIARMKRLTNLDRAEDQVVDLNELLTDAVAFLSGDVERKAEVSLELAPLPPVHCRPHQMGAVFSNLIRNAAAAMDEKGLIRIKSERRNGDIVLEIEDNGHGMPETQVAELFDPQFHIESGRVSTTNWGLFICRSIVTEHGGLIEIESEVGVGTKARVLLPVAAEH